MPQPPQSDSTPPDSHLEAPGALPPTAPCAPSEAALRRQAVRLARLPEPPWLHQEAARRLAAKLAPIRLQPANWIEWSAHLGAGCEGVQAHYPEAQHWVVEPDDALRRRTIHDMAQQAGRSWRNLWRKQAPEVWLPHALQGAPWQPEGAQMLWANMTLHAHPSPSALMAQWFDQLSADGFLMCSGLGPDTGRELRALYRERAWPLPTIDFIDMHDLGDELVRAGFADPVMDMEKLTLTWDSPEAMLQELRTWGGNVAGGRYAGLRTPRWRAELLEAVRQRLQRPDGRYGLTVELIFGHAVKPRPRPKIEAETRVSLQDMRRMVRSPGRS